MDTDLWLPENLKREALVEQQIALAREWTKIIRAVYPDCSVVFVKDTPAAKEAKLVPGRWHVKKVNRGIPDSYMPITTPDGGYREPDSGVLNEMGDRDMWRSPGVGSEHLRRRETEQRQKDRDAALRREQQRDHMAEDFRAARRIPGEDVDGKRAWDHNRRRRNG